VIFGDLFISYLYTLIFITWIFIQLCCSETFRSLLIKLIKFERYDYKNCTLETCKPCSVRNPVEVPRWWLDWQTFHRLFPGLWSWIRQHTCHHCEHTPSCIPSSSSCCWRPWVAEPWHIGHLRSLTWLAWISSCHKWTRSSFLILQRPAECWPTQKSAENLAALLEYFCSNKKLLISERASSATTWCQMTQWSVAAVAMTLWRCYQGNSVHPLPWWQLRAYAHRTCLFVTLVYRLFFICNK